MKQYFECHITIEPVFDEKLVLFTNIASNQGFRVAKLLMQKDRTGTGERSTKDSFCTGHAKTYEEIELRMKNLTTLLQEAGFDVWRRKIEHVIYDEKFSNGNQ